MVIASDFETRSYRSLWFRFGRQFLFFIICLFSAAGILYGIERNSAALSASEGFDQESWERQNVRHVEEFLNGTGFKAIQEFSKTHQVDSKTVNGFVHKLAELTYARYTSSNYTDSSDSYYDNLRHKGMTYLEAFVCVLSVLTTVGKPLKCCRICLLNVIMQYFVRGN